MEQQFQLRSSSAGFSLVEMMIAMTIGLMITAGLVTIFANTSNTQQELRRTSQQIENGRYAMDVLTQDVQLTGYYGQYRAYSAPATAPDPCSLLQADLLAGISLPVQGYNAAVLSADPSVPATCGGLLPASATQNGSDVLVIRRADTQFLQVQTNVPTQAGQFYIQATPTTLDLQLGGGTTSCTSKADGSAAAITRRLQYPTSTDICSTTAAPAGYIRKLHVHIYFVSPCDVPTTAGGACDATADNGNPIPTLKRLELSTDGTNTIFNTVSIAEGVEVMKIAYGIDDTPSTVNSDTGMIGDGSPDRYVLAPALADLTNAVTVRIDLLVRNPEPSAGFTDTKTYGLGVDPVVNTNPAITIPATSLDRTYRRHVYSAEVRLVNLASRKEIP